MYKHLKSVVAVALAGLLLTTSVSAARNPVCIEADGLLRDPGQRKSAELHYTIDRHGSQEQQWWSNYQASGERSAVKYVRDIASDRPQEAMWFLLTGGLHGFRDSPATKDEEKILLQAMEIVAKRVATARSQDPSLEGWARQIASKTYAGQNHLERVMGVVARLTAEVDRLTDETSVLRVRVTSLEERLEQAEKERKVDRASLEQERKERKESETKRVDELKLHKDEVVAAIAKGQADRTADQAEAKADRENFLAEIKASKAGVDSLVDKFMKRQEEIDKKKCTRVESY